MIDRSTAGAATGGKRDEGAGFFPLSFFVGAMAMGRGESSSWIGRGSWSQRRKEGQEARGRRKENSCVQPRVRLAGRIMRRRGEAGTPTSNQPPRGAQGRRLLGPAALRTCPLALPLSQVRAHLRPGGYCRCSGNGGPQTCLPAARGMAPPVAQYGPTSLTKHSRPSRGAKPRGADDTGLPQARPHQAGS